MARAAPASAQSHLHAHVPGRALPNPTHPTPRTRAGDYVIVTAAGSALGRMAISYGKNEAGVKVIGTVRRPEQVEELKAAG
mgnify:CR=1 FL=1